MKKCFLTMISCLCFFFGTFAVVAYSQTAPDLTPKLPHFEFSVSGCDYHATLPKINPKLDPPPPPKKNPDRRLQRYNINITSENNSLSFTHDLNYVCCADWQLSSNVDDNVITIIERNNGDLCRCMCTYQVAGKLEQLPQGTYDVRFYLQDPNYNNEFQFLFNQQVNLTRS